MGVPSGRPFGLGSTYTFGISRSAVMMQVTVHRRPVTNYTTATAPTHQGSSRIHGVMATASVAVQNLMICGGVVRLKNDANSTPLAIFESSRDLVMVGHSSPQIRWEPYFEAARGEGSVAGGKMRSYPAAPGHPGTPDRLPRGLRPRAPKIRRPLPPNPQQPHRRARPDSLRGWNLQARPRPLEAAQSCRRYARVAE